MQINNSLAIVLIIAHKTELSPEEQASLKQCYKVLGNYNIRLICPKGLDISLYKEIIPNIEFDFINPKWQSNYYMFNRLKISPLLYLKYKKFKYILFYELDAWVFRDELEYWCSQNYDYIGAPWYEGFSNAKENSKFIGIGNGGFSLRKVSSHLKALFSFGYIRSPTHFLKNSTIKKRFNIKDLLRLFLNLTIRNNTFYLFNDYNLHEDYFWGIIISKNNKWFTLPTEEIASKFSIEKKAPFLLKETNDLPFGCHGWNKYDSDYWKNHIDY